MEQKEESQIEKIERIIERAMEKNNEYIDMNIEKVLRSQERMRGIRSQNYKSRKKVGIQNIQNKSYEERRIAERKQERQQWKKEWKNKEKREQDRKTDSEEEDWYNDHDYNY